MAVFYARNEYLATAGQTDFTFSFPYISQNHIYAFVNGSLVTTWTLSSPFILKFDSGLNAGDNVVILRRTSYNTRLVDWVSGSVISEADMDVDSLQGFYMAQEAVDIARTSGLPYADDSNYTAGNRQIHDVAPPTEGADAVTKEYVDALTIDAGNVPIPDTPGEDNLVLVAGNGAWDWGRVKPEIVDVSSDVGSVLNCANTAAIRTTLGLGTAATKNTGTNVNNVPILDSGGVMPAVGLGSMTGLRTLVPIVNGTLSGASVDIEPAGLTSYPLLYLELHGVTTADSSDRYLQMRWKLNGSWVTAAASYTWAVAMALMGTDTYAHYSNSDALMRISIQQRASSKTTLSMGLLISNNVQFLSGKNPSYRAIWMMQFHYSANAWLRNDYCFGGVKSDLPYSVQGIRLYFSAGNFNSGKYYLYGINSLT